MHIRSSQVRIRQALAGGYNRPLGPAAAKPACAG
jgi:hypothetical protein